jgi:hypothetical protein
MKAKAAVSGILLAFYAFAAASVDGNLATS